VRSINPLDYRVISRKSVKTLKEAILERERTVLDRERAIQKVEAERDNLRREIASLTRNGVFDQTETLTLAERINRAISSLDGWCTIRKAEMLSCLIQTNDCKTALEVGIYAGRSLIPMALTMKHLGRGYVIGVDPWSNCEATKVATNAENDKWWNELDLVLIKSSFHISLVKFGVLPFVKTLELNSEQAFAALADQKFGLIHVDGGHSEEQAYRDVTNWSTLLERGGILVMDDIEWETVKKARSWVLDHYELIQEVSENGNAYGAYRKR
jgi:predicted O-methyltransferase YrrM